MVTRTNFADLLQLEARQYESLRFLGEAAYLCLYRGEAQRSTCLFEALTELAPGDPVGPLGLCELHMAAGRYREAERCALQATRATGIDAPTMAFAYLQRGLALMRAHKVEAAEASLREALEVDPGSDVGRSARELIEGLREAGDREARASGQESSDGESQAETT